MVARLLLLRFSTGRLRKRSRRAVRRSSVKWRRREKKTARESLERDERAGQDAAHLSNLLYPHKHLQERLHSILPFVAKHGFDLIDRIEEHTCIDCVDHHVMAI